MFSFGGDGEFLAVETGAGQGDADGALFRLYSTVNQGQIFFFNFPGFELSLKFDERRLGFGNYQAAGGFFVQAVDDTGTEQKCLMIIRHS